MSEVDWSRLPALTTLRAFEATARLNGYSPAARSLNVTPAAVAQQVRKLEADTGAILVRRQGRGLVLTEAGQHLAFSLREAFSVIAKGFDDLALRQARRSVRVSTTDFFGSAVILPHLDDFWRKHPGAEVSFTPEGNSATVNVEAFDIVIRGGPPGTTWEGYVATPLIRSPFVICAAPSLLGGTAQAPDQVDLATLPWIRDHSIGGDIFERIVKQVGCDPVDLEIVDPGSAKFEIEALLLGYGIGFGPEIILSQELARGTLVKIRTVPDMSGEYAAITRNGALDPPVVNFLTWLTATCAGLA